MDNNTRFSQYIRALQQYTSRKNNAEVPAQHIEILDNSEIRLGAWVSYMRQRRKNGKLPAAYVEELMKINGWTWGPLRRGPRKKNERNAKILEMRSTGHSITQISDAFNISRQRVHQIVKSNEF
jgi:DNA-binding NarL/FixJ family response regulator